MTNRTVVVKRGMYRWEVIDFKDLHIGDNFRLFEPNGDSVFNEKNEFIFCATSNAFYSNELEAWMINTE